MRSLLVLVLAIGVNLGAWALGLSDYHVVKVGMSFSQVVSILGTPTREVPGAPLYEGARTFAWETKQGTSVVVMIVNGKVVDKGQYGLR